MKYEKDRKIFGIDEYLIIKYLKKYARPLIAGLLVLIILISDMPKRLRKNKESEPAAVTQAENEEPYTGSLGFINLSWSLVSLDDYGTVPRTSSDILAGVEIRANTASGIRAAVETIGDKLGATVINPQQSN